VLKREASNFFKKLFQSNNQCAPESLQLPNIPHISRVFIDYLLSRVYKREVKDAIYSMSPYKALDPNDFQPIFFTPYLAETLIVSIPKADEPQILVEFRPISLCNVLLTYFKGFGSKN